MGFQRRYKKTKHQWLKLLITTILVVIFSHNSANLLAQTEAVTEADVKINNTVNYTYSDSSNKVFNNNSETITVALPRLRDPLGRVTGCAGEILPDYTGFKVGLYETAANGIDISEPVIFTPTEVPDVLNNNVPLGLAPNAQNSNPFFLTNSDRGTYNFLFDVKRGQLDAGRTYILLVSPASNSIYDQRRIKIVMGVHNNDKVTYTATSLDGKPISTTDSRTTVEGTIRINDAERVGLSLSVLRVNATICQAQEIKITKTGDRSAAEPGDTVIYRLSIKNLASAPLNNIVISDNLPLGFNFLAKSVRAEYSGQSIPVRVSNNKSSITLDLQGFVFPESKLEENLSLNIVYAAVLTPDSIRGTGENSASAVAQRTDIARQVKDGPAIYKIRIQPGILSDCGTLIGRVFIDKNFDGEQQRNEPGIPNAVIYMDDGNRIVTDANGVFSVANVISGYRTAVLDLSSLPGYALAPNLYIRERNSQSRLVRLEPSGLARINFAVTPAFQEGKQP